MAAGASAHAVAGRRQAGRSRLRPVLRLAVSLDRELPEAAGDQPRRAGGAARQDRSGDPAHPFAIGLVQLAGGRRAAEPDQGDGRGRAERPAGARHREHRRAGLVQGCRAHQGVRAGRRAACLRSAGARRRRARVRAPGQGRQARPGALLAAEGARAAVAEPQAHSDGHHRVGGVLSRPLRSLHCRTI